MAVTGDVQIDNGTFTVTKWSIDPGEAIPMHVHQHDYVVVPLVDETMHVTSADGAEVVAELRIGESYVRVAGAEHTVANRGTRPVVFVEIEKIG